MHTECVTNASQHVPPTPESLVFELVLGLTDLRHKDLARACEELGLPAPPPAAVSSDGSAQLSKSQRMEAVFSQIQPDGYLSVLQRFVDRGLAPRQRNAAEDLVWASQCWPMLDKRTRREVAAQLDEARPFWSDRDGLLALIRRRWVDDPNQWWVPGLVDEVEQHMVSKDDWTALDFFKNVGAMDCPDRRFALFLQELLSGAVNPDEQRLHNLADAVDTALQTAELRLIEVGQGDGYPAFEIVPTNAPAQPPRLLLFASRVTKPDMRIIDVLDTEIELLTSSDEILRYDRQIHQKGLHWQDLQKWWAEQNGLAWADAKTPLWNRLLDAVPSETSPPQRRLFEMYHSIYGQENSFPALLPEVWVHWDPQTLAQRGVAAYLTHRMDFLMLLSGHRRVVLEVDGKQHYAKNGRPSPAVYARTMQGDRDLRLNGYDVYRFGTHELEENRAESTVRRFFDRLLSN